MKYRKISLIGMMGTGKTLISEHLSIKLDFPLYDSDKYIEKHTNLSIAQIFKNSGEAYFRNLEKKYINEIVEFDQDFILSCGGGSFIAKEVRDILSQNTIVFWLQSSPETIYSRIRYDKTRPLLGKNNSIEHISAIIKERTPFYQLAHHKICTDNKSPQELCNEIIDKL